MENHVIFTSLPVSYLLSPRNGAGIFLEARTPRSKAGIPGMRGKMIGPGLERRGKGKEVYPSLDSNIIPYI